MALIDVSGWASDAFGWRATANGATYDRPTPSSLFSRREPIPADRKVTVYATVRGETDGPLSGSGRVRITGYNDAGGAAFTAESASTSNGTVGASATFPDGIARYRIDLAATPAIVDRAGLAPLPFAAGLVGWVALQAGWSVSGDEVTYDPTVSGEAVGYLYYNDPQPFAVGSGKVFRAEVDMGNSGVSACYYFNGTTYTGVETGDPNRNRYPTRAYPQAIGTHCAPGVVAFTDGVRPTTFRNLTFAIGDDEVLGVTFSAVSTASAPPGGAVPGQIVRGEGGEVISQGPRPSTNVKPGIPTSQHALVRGDKIDKNWYQYLNSLGDAVPTAAEMETKVAAAVGAIPPPEIPFLPSTTITVTGNGKDGYTHRLVTIGSESATPAVFKATVDEYGRTRGPIPATTDDVPEGAANLYHSTERAQDAVGAAITAGAGDGVTLTYDDAGNKIDATNTDKGSVAVTAHVALADPHPQYLTPAEGDAAYAPLSHVGTGGAAHANVVAGGASGFMTGADKTKLDGVATGATAYTDAMARAAAVADSITDGVTNIAPSQNAVFDALALKASAESVDAIETLLWIQREGGSGAAPPTTAVEPDETLNWIGL